MRTLHSRVSAFVLWSSLATLGWLIALSFDHANAQSPPDSAADPPSKQETAPAAFTLPQPPAGELPAGHSMHGEAFNEGPRQAAYLMGGTGKVHLAVTTESPAVQLFFDQGLGQLHGFWYWEAERSFRQAAAMDPHCAMAYWGMAMANVNNSDRALKFIREAVKRNSGNSRHEALYIEALSAYYEDWDAARDKAVEAPNAESKPAAEKPAASAMGSARGKSRGRRNRRRAADDSQKAAEKTRKQNYLDKLQAIRKEFPDDLEAKAFLAYYRWNWRSDVPIGDREAVDALLSEVFQAEPMHPAHHYRIHLWDDARPERALASAALCGQSAPAIAHMWHMPGHIYSKLHRYQDAVYQQEASARVDHAYMLRDRVVPYRIHNYAHNNEWLIRDLIYIGRVRDAVHLAQNLIEVPRHPQLNLPTNGGSAAAYGRQRLFDVLTLYELWDDYIRLAPTIYLAPGDSEKEQVRHIRWLGVAHFAVGNRIQGGRQLAVLQERLGKLKNEQDAAGKSAETQAQEKEMAADAVQKAREDARKPFNDRVRDMEKALAHVRGMEAAADGDYQIAMPLFEQAGDLAKPHLARAWLKAGDFSKAEKLAREAADAGRNEVYPLATLVEVLYEIGQHGDATPDNAAPDNTAPDDAKPDDAKPDDAKPDDAEPDDAKLANAKKAFEQLRAVASASDLQAPIFDRLARIAAALGYTSEWRLPSSAAPDIGVRPPLESLGPLLWQPPLAVSWTLLNENEEPVSIYDYAGKPVVVIFYLGYGCLHCAEQLQAFAPLADQFRAAGIELVAVSTDSVADLKKSIEAYRGSAPAVENAAVAASADTADQQAGDANAGRNGSRGAAANQSAFPLTLVSNDDLRLFKVYGCFDDFEQRPLHGTFLIDKDRRVRWQETGAEPFQDAAFLLEEAKRLIALPSP